MQLLPFFFTQLPQFVLNFTNPTASLSSSTPQVTGSAGMEGAKQYKLPALPYAYDALEPYIAGEIMKLHHGKHHQTYVNNLNAAFASNAQKSDVRGQIENQQIIKFNGGGHINHSLFWANLAPASSPAAKTDAAPKLIEALEKKYGGFTEFRSNFKTALLGIQGSGWGWLIKKNDGELDIVTTKDQDPVIRAQVIFGVDMWEHAYYIQYFNDKASYVDGIWNVINWEESEKRFLGLVGPLEL